MQSRLSFSFLLCLPLLFPVVAHAGWQLNGTPVSTAIADQSVPAILSDGEGGAILTWHDGRSGNYDIYAQRLNASGVAQWTPDGIAICAAANNQQYPTIASDGAGGAIVTWHDYRGGAADIYAQRVSASGVMQWAADGIPLCAATGFQDEPTIVSDGAGGAIVTWYDQRGPSFDIYAQRINAKGAVQWTENGVALCTAANDGLYPTIVSDGAGGAIVTWQDYRSGPFSDIYAQRISVAGVVQWAADGVGLCTVEKNQYHPKILADGAGGAIVTWQDYRSGTNWDVYLQRINAAGAVQWTLDGLRLCATANQQIEPMIVSDGAGGAILTWADRRNGSYFNIYSQRINAAGAVQWAATGVALSTALGDQQYPTIVSDGVGGAIVTWFDRRNAANYDIYAQRINAAGAVQWMATGVALSTALGDQEFPTIASDGVGGAIVTWFDGRSGTNDDIYAQRVTASGLVPTAVRPTPSDSNVLLSTNYPNPFAGATAFDLTLQHDAKVSIEVFDAAGRRVHKETVNGSKGWQKLSFFGVDDRGRALPSGVYFYKVSANGTTIARKVMIAR